MIIHSLKLKNYRKFKDDFIEFPEGLFGIVGNNGVGKTSIIEAIAWAIYGIKGSKTEKELIKREEAEPESSCVAELEFILGDDSYRVLRELRGKRQSAHASLFVNNHQQPEVDGINQVTSYLSNKLGMDYNSFFTSIFTKQKELDALSDLTPATRKKRILRLLRIDRIDVAIKNLRSDKKDSEKIIEGIRITQQDINELNSKLEELEKQKVQKEEKVKLEEKAVKEAEVDSTKAKMLKDLQETKYKEYQSFDTKLQVLENTKKLNTTNLNNKKDELKKLQDANKTLTQILPKLKSFKTIKTKKEKLDSLLEKHVKKTEFENQIKDIDEAISSLKREEKNLIEKLKESKNLEEKLKSIEEKIESYNNDSKTIIKKIERNETSVEQYKKQRKDFATEFEKIKRLGPRSKCPTCKKAIGNDLASIVKHFENEISKFTSKINSEITSIEQLSKQADKISKLLENQKKAKKSLENLLQQKTKDIEKKANFEQQITQQNTNKHTLQQKILKIGKVEYDKEEHEGLKMSLKELEALDKQCTGLKKDVSRISSITESINTLTKNISTVEIKMVSVSKSIKSLSFNEQDYEMAKKKYDDAITHFHNKEKDLISAKNEVTTILQEITNTVNQIAEEKEKENQIKNEQKKIEILIILDKIFGDFRSELISRIIPILSVRASELFRKITEEKYPNMTLDENYQILIEDGGKQFPLYRFSGGEEDLASLCLRIAISKVIKERTGGEGINFIVLDEIFGGQDETRKKNILKALNDLSSQFQQIVVITQIEEIKDMLPYAFNVIETSDKSSKIIAEGTPSLVLSK